MHTRDMTEGRPLKLILLVALPLMLGSVFQQLYTVVDAAVVGRCIGLEALAALGSADWFTWLWLSLAQGLAQGFVIPIAQAFGAHDEADLRRWTGGAVLLAAGSTVLLALGAQLSVVPVLRLLGTPEEILPTAAAYLRAIFLGMPVVMAYNLLAGMLRSLGDARSPLMAMVAASLLNIALDLLFVMAFHWGVVGAAAATVIAQACSALFCLLRVLRVEALRLSRADLRLEPVRAARLMKLGLPVSLQNAVIAVGGMIVQSAVNPMGVAFIAGYTATNKLYGLLEIAAVNYGYALMTFAGQNYGAKRHDRIRAGVRTGVLAGVLTALGIAGVMFLFGRSLLSLFVDPAANGGQSIGYAVEFLRLMSASLPILYVLYVYRSTLQGVGDTLMPMVSGLAEFVMRTGSALLLPAVISYRGLFWAEVLAWLGADLILIPTYYRRQRNWRDGRLTKHI